MPPVPAIRIRTGGSGCRWPPDARAPIYWPPGTRSAAKGCSMTSGAPIDLRSDTVTKPSAAMRRAMADAEVGDDWYGDDPTVNRLQDRAAELTGREAAAYLPTGTMCTQVAVHALTRSGRFVVCEATYHVGGTEVTTAAVRS